ncbi:unnamed protein product [Phytophthora lilii]|uniref:Unnamed protein product n=1 Tax=Phytophthora lilii TaxID=2077276 RepID=A0A9W6U7Y3_9STRA|nr:unnamed protein product [Phytophthora lilii]
MPNSEGGNSDSAGMIALEATDDNCLFGESLAPSEVSITTGVPTLSRSSASASHESEDEKETSSLSAEALERLDQSGTLADSRSCPWKRRFLGDL